MIRRLLIASSAVLALSSVTGCAVESTESDEGNLEAAGTAVPASSTATKIAEKLDLGSRTETRRPLSEREKTNACATDFDGKIVGRFDRGTIYQVHEATTGAVGTAGIRSANGRFCVSVFNVESREGQQMVSTAVLDGGFLDAVLALDMGRFVHSDCGAGTCGYEFANATILASQRYVYDECAEAMMSNDPQEEAACERNFLRDQATNILTPSGDTMLMEGTEGTVNEIQIASTSPLNGRAPLPMTAALLATRYQLGSLTSSNIGGKHATFSYESLSGKRSTVTINESSSSYNVCFPDSMICPWEGEVPHGMAE